MREIGRVRRWWYNIITPPTIKEMFIVQDAIIENYTQLEEELENEIERLTEDNNTFKEVNAEITQELILSEDLVYKLKEENSDQRYQMEQLEREIEQLGDEMERAEQTIEELEDEIDSLIEGRQELHWEIDDLIAELEERED